MGRAAGLAWPGCIKGTIDAKHAYATRGRGSAALMQNDFDTAARMLWSAIDLVRPGSAPHWELP